MTSVMNLYFIGIGSNVDYERNVLRILAALSSLTKLLHISSIIRTAPVGMKSKNEFLNLCVAIRSNISLEELKNITNDIEIRLGRDRRDPFRRVKDRPADLDILLSIPMDKVGKMQNILVPKQLYSALPLLELLQFLGYQYHDVVLSPFSYDTLKRVPLEFHGQIIGIQPITIELFSQQ